MDHRRNFGRRAVPQVNVASAPQRASVRGEETARAVVHRMAAAASVDDEIRAWKSARGSLADFPWRQFSLMAALCFGAASFLLPESVNDAVQWLLYALAAMGFYAGLYKRKTKPG